MTFNEHPSSFAGRPVVDVHVGEPLPAVVDPVAWRFSVWDCDDGNEEVPCPKVAAAFDELVRENGPSVESLVIGASGYAALDPARDRFPALRRLGLGSSEVAEALASAPIVARLERLDLSNGDARRPRRGGPARRAATHPPRRAGPAPPLPLP
jgi:hypothetical protein